jgi:hypothetical protein
MIYRIIRNNVSENTYNLPHCTHEFMTSCNFTCFSFRAQAVKMQTRDLDETQGVEDADVNGNKEEMRDWKSLTADLIPSIADRLITLGDYATMRLVCTNWGWNIDPMPRNNKLLLPVLLCYHEPTSSVRLFDVTHSRIYTKELPLEVNTRTFLFSTNEFIINIAPDEPHEIMLTDIFTQTQIWLPTPPSDLIYDPIFEDWGIDARDVIRIVISPPSLQCFVVVYQLNGSMYGYCEVHGNCWSMFEFQNNEANIASMLFYKGDLYAVLTDYCLTTVTFHPELNLTLLNVDSVDKDTNPELPWGATIDELSHEEHMLCVLADAGDDLLLVFISLNSIEVKIFCWDFKVQKWVKPSSIGGRSVFVSFRGFLAWMFPCDGFWAKPDRVYVVDNLSFCLEYTLDGTYQECYGMMKLENIAFPDPPVWMFPKFSNVG